MTVKLENWSFVDNTWNGACRFPYLEEFKPIKEGFCLVGQVQGHPKVIDGHRAFTSPVQKIDTGARTCQTLTGTIYELGAPLEDYVSYIQHVNYAELLIK